MCTPARSWLIILTLEPIPGASPSRWTLAAIASSTASAFLNASFVPEAMIESSPLAARAAPPDTGASIMRMPLACSRSPRSVANSGATVLLAMTTEPLAKVPAAPSLPNRTSLVWSAFTTSMTTTSAWRPTAAGLAAATPPSSANAFATSGRTSQACTSKPFLSSVRATPMPIDPKPITPTACFFLAAIASLPVCRMCCFAVKLQRVFVLTGTMRSSIVCYAACALVIAACHSNPHYNPMKTHHTPGGFRNNYPHTPKQSFWKWQWQRWTKGIPADPEAGYNFPLLKPDAVFLAANRTRPTLTWIGHATFLLQLGGVNVLTDLPGAPLHRVSISRASRTWMSWSSRTTTTIISTAKPSGA